MDSFNKVISFILGLVVVLVFVAVITGKINFKKGLPTLANVTPTVTPSPTKTPSSKVSINPTMSAGSGSYTSYNNSGKTTTPSKIPSTGLPTLFIPSLLAAATGGSFLRKTGKK